MASLSGSVLAAPAQKLDSCPQLSKWGKCFQQDVAWTSALIITNHL